MGQIVHAISKGTLWVKYDPDWAKETEDMSQQEISVAQTNGWMGGRMDKQTDHYRRAAGRGQ